MAPDLNSLPPSRSSTSSPLQQRSNMPAVISTSTSTGANTAAEGVTSTSSRSSSATIPLNNASTDLSHRSSLSGGHRSSPHSTRPSISEGRRRSGMGIAFGMGLNESADHHERRSPSFSSNFRTASPNSLGGSPIIATGDPHHQRTPSLGMLHQELEQEQEAQVNRLLQMIRQQQVQLHQLQQAQQQTPSSSSGTAVVDEITTPSSERSLQFPSLPVSIPPLPTPGSQSRAIQQPTFHIPFAARRGSRTSEGMSPMWGSAAAAAAADAHTQPPSASMDTLDLRYNTHSSPGSEWSVLAGGSDPSSARRTSRDESAYYQAEAASLTRENQMLKSRIRELERQLGSLSAQHSHGVEGASDAGTTTANGHVIVSSTSASTSPAATAATQDQPGSEKT